MLISFNIILFELLKSYDDVYRIIFEWSWFIAVSCWSLKEKVSNFELGLRIVEIVVEVSSIC